MNITEIDIENLQEKLNGLRGYGVVYKKYFNDHDHLRIDFEYPDKETIGLTFVACTYLAGHVEWKDCNLKCKLYKFDNDSVGMEITDTKAEFIVRCHALSLYGDNGITIPDF